MAQGAILTIGYGTRPFEEFAALLKNAAIDVVCDVRSTPYSSRFPDYSRESLHAKLKDAGITYLFLGDLLGARPSDPECYENGKASYDAIARSSAFRQGIERVESGSKQYRVALMCAEKEPLNCHRAVLVSRVLVADGFDVRHIDARGSEETHRDLETRLLCRYQLEQTSLFDERSRMADLAEAYARRGKELAYDVQAAYDRSSR